MKKWLTLKVFYAFLIISVNVFSAGQQSMAVPDSGLEYEDLQNGSGATAKIGTIVVIHVTGWLIESGKKGPEFLNTYDRGKPMSFKLGTEYVMKALNEGVKGMKVGGKRRIMVPSKLGYGTKGADNIVPPNAELILEVELIDAD